jgi:adenylate kinase family enzyme
MAKLVCNRLSEPDCRLNGYILSDFPVTAQQCEFMEKAGHMPTHAIFKDFSYQKMHAYRKTFF